MIAVLAHLRAAGDPWAAITYFSLWAVRLSGIFPELPVRTDRPKIPSQMLERCLFRAHPLVMVEINGEPILGRALVPAVERRDFERQISDRPSIGGAL